VRRKIWGCLALGVLLLLGGGYLSLQASPDASFDRPMTFEDPGGRLGIDDIRTELFAKNFSPRAPGLGFRASAFWLRFSVVNPTDKDVPYWFDTGNRTLQEVDLYVFDSAGNRAHQLTGSKFPYAQRPLDTDYFVFPLSVPAHGSSELYLRVRSTGYLNTQLVPHLWTPQDYLRHQQAERMLWACYLGMAASLAALNLMLWFYLKDRSYLLYVLSLFGMVCTVSTMFGGYGSSYRLFWPAYPVFEQISWVLVATFTDIFVPLFIARLIDMGRLKPLLRNAMIVLIAVTCLNCAVLTGLTWLQNADAASLQRIYILGTATSSAIYICLFVATLYALRERNRAAVFLCVANTPLMAWVSLNAVGVLMSGKPAGGASMMFGSAFEFTVMALALADRFNQERKQRMAAKQALIEALQRSEQELEQKVLQRTLELNVEKERAKELLHNILPVELAEELSRTGKAHSARHEAATILFADFSDFTDLASTMPADRMVGELNDIFAAFDDIVDEVGLEKIKTIGDAYMAAAGLPKPCEDHAQRCVRAGLRMIDFIERRNQSSTYKWGVRVGIHSGPVVSGVVGKRKYAFDIWGDTVNIASRMESAGAAGRVNLSAYTTDLARRDFECEYRGKLEAKGKGKMDMYFVVGERNSLAKEA